MEPPSAVSAEGAVVIGPAAGRDSDEVTTILEPLLAIRRASKEDIKISVSGGLEVEARAIPVRERLASLDVFRGLTIAIMILVDDGGGKWPAINHSPWNGVTLADFVMPAFLFIVGLSITLAYKRVPSKWAATVKALSRTLKLWLLGVLLQGGYYHGLNDLAYGVDVQLIRWCGILQRIGLAYLVVTLCEIWNPRVSSLSLPDGTHAILKMYFWHWVVAGLLSTVYLILLYGLYVPDWEFVPSTDPSSVLKVKCGVRGDLNPPCNAVGYLDRLLLGINHLYKNPMYKRTKDCSINSPDYGPMPVDAPNWCLAPFDPEGLLSSVSAVCSCFIGVHYGHILVHMKGHSNRVTHWAIPAFVMILIGITLHYLGIPLNKPLYSLSYVFLTAGAAGLVFVAMYLLVDVYGIRWPTILFEWMGMNSLLLYVLVACGVAAAAIQGLYWQTPEQNLVDYVEEHSFQVIFSSGRIAKLAYVLFEIIIWSFVAGALHAKGIYWKF
ncbi:unnamed protein product [Calypogeia fissa]